MKMYWIICPELRPVPTKPLIFVLTNMSNGRLTYVRKIDLVDIHIFANRPVDTVSSLPSDRRLTVADNTRQKRRTGTNQWTRVCIDTSYEYYPLEYSLCLHNVTRLR